MNKKIHRQGDREAATCSFLWPLNCQFRLDDISVVYITLCVCVPCACIHLRHTHASSSRELQQDLDIYFILCFFSSFFYSFNSSELSPSPLPFPFIFTSCPLVSKSTLCLSWIKKHITFLKLVSFRHTSTKIATRDQGKRVAKYAFLHTISHQLSISSLIPPEKTNERTTRHECRAPYRRPWHPLPDTPHHGRTIGKWHTDTNINAIINVAFSLQFSFLSISLSHAHRATLDTFFLHFLDAALPRQMLGLDTLGMKVQELKKKRLIVFWLLFSFLSPLSLLFYSLWPRLPPSLSFLFPFNLFFSSRSLSSFHPSLKIHSLQTITKKKTNSLRLSRLGHQPRHFISCSTLDQVSHESKQHCQITPQLCNQAP